MPGTARQRPAALWPRSGAVGRRWLIGKPPELPHYYKTGIVINERGLVTIRGRALLLFFIARWALSWICSTGYT